MRKTVLCVEDNISNMTLVSRIVEAEGHTLVRAETGTRAAEILTTLVPDVILLDINIPGINGLDLARQIRANKDNLDLASVPIIATTANVLLGDRERCLEAGCDEYLPKPLDIRRLRQMIRSYLDIEV